MNNRVQLPGGALIDGEIQRCARFKPITGELELIITSQSNQYVSRPVWVSDVLAAAVDQIGATDMNRALADRLSVGDRIYLMLQLGLRYSGDQLWLTPTCESCEERFDVSVKRSELPIQCAGSAYPASQVNIKGRELNVRAINGEDQKWLNENPAADSVQALLNRCVQIADGKTACP